MEITIKSVWMKTEVEVNDNLKIHDLIQSMYKQHELVFHYYNNIYLLVGNIMVPLDACKTVFESGISDGDTIYVEDVSLFGGGGPELFIINFVIGLLSGLSAQFVYNKVNKRTKSTLSQDHILQILDIFKMKQEKEVITGRKFKLMPSFIRRKIFCNETVKVILRELQEWYSICSEIGPELLVRFEEKRIWTVEELTASTGFKAQIIEECLNKLEYFGKVKEFKSICPHIFESEVHLTLKIDSLLRRYV